MKREGTAVGDGESKTKRSLDLNAEMEDEPDKAQCRPKTAGSDDDRSVGSGNMVSLLPCGTESGDKKATEETDDCGVAVASLNKANTDSANTRSIDQVLVHFDVMSLNGNIGAAGDSRQEFDAWLQQLGNGTLPIVQKPDFIELPADNVFPINDDSKEATAKSMLQFAKLIYPDLLEKAKKPPSEWISWVAERAILAPRCTEVDEMNAIVTKQLSGTLITLYSADQTVEIDDSTQFPMEYLNSLTPDGFPPHRLLLKEGMILVLLRDISPQGGLCIGTRLILVDATTILMRCKIATGGHTGEEVLLPRIEWKSKEGDYGFQWRRRQFPVRPAFAITIKQSQNEPTLRTVGVWLQEPVCTPGQLYVAASRAGDPKQLHFAVPKSYGRKTRNVVSK